MGASAVEDETAWRADPVLSRRIRMARIQNQSLRYAIHQLAKPIGIVASSAHQIGKTRSATIPRAMKTSQKTLRSMPGL